MTNTKKIDHTIRCINDTEALVSKAFAKRAVIYKTEEYILWHDFLKDYPNAKMVTKTIKKNSKKRTYRNLTYVNMGRYISVNAPQLLTEFEKEKDSAQAQENPYRAVLAWFLKAFPNYDDYKKFFEDMDKNKTADVPAELTTAAEHGIDFTKGQLNKQASGF